MRVVLFTGKGGVGKTTFAAATAVRAARAGVIADELILAVAGRRRLLALPSVLRHREVAGARLQGGRLEVTFSPAARHRGPVASR